MVGSPELEKKMACGARRWAGRPAVGCRRLRGGGGGGGFMVFELPGFGFTWDLPWPVGLEGWPGRRQA
jgi:hypothetical protein